MAAPPSRTRLLVTVALVAVCAAASFYFMSRPPRPGAVVLVSIDTLRADRLPLYGYTAGRTPALDALAKESVVFDKAYAHAPQTLPSHASMLTGLLPFEHKVRDNLGFRLADGVPTMAGLFRSAGYRTAGFVSAYVLRPETGIGQGFDVFNAEFPPVSADRSPGQVQRAGTDTLAAARTWLDAQADARFLLFFHIYEPHKPYAPPERFRSADPYDGEVSFSDDIVGGLIAALRAKGWYDDATLIVTADHGEGLGDHGELEHGLFVYDEAIRVPWIVKPRGSRAGGRRVPAPVQHIDLLPTMAAIAGFASPAGLRGRNLMPAIENTGAIAPQGIYSEALYPRYHFGWSELLALTDERYRYIKAPREELYDLERDPDERVNLMTERPQAAAALRTGLDSLVAGRGIDTPSAVSAEDRERLAALGYIGTQSSTATAPGTSLPDPKDKAGILREYREAIELIGRDQLAEGAKRLGAILEREPGMTDVWSQYGGVLTRLGRPAEALRAYQQMITLNPEEASGALGAASSLLALGRYDDARRHAELAIGRAPASAHESIAKIELARKNYQEAVKEAQLAQQADAALPLPLLIRGLIEYQEGRYAEALKYLMPARDAYAKRALQAADLHFYIGDSLARLERYADAERFLREEVRLYPSGIRARAGLAMLYQATGRPADADRAIADMLAANPSAPSYDTAAQLWTMFGAPERAKAARDAARQRGLTAR